MEELEIKLPNKVRKAKKIARKRSGIRVSEEKEEQPVEPFEDKEYVNKVYQELEQAREAGMSKLHETIQEMNESILEINQPIDGEEEEEELTDDEVEALKKDSADTEQSKISTERVQKVVDELSDMFHLAEKGFDVKSFLDKGGKVKVELESADFEISITVKDCISCLGI